MHLKYLFGVRLKNQLKDPFLMIMIFTSLLISILIPIMTNKSTDEKMELGIINLDIGQYSEEMIDYLESLDLFNLSVLNKQDAEDALNKNKVEAIITLNDHYSDKIKKLEYEDIVSIESSLSSKGSSIISETIINKTLMFWASEVSIAHTNAFLQENNVEWNNINLQKHRQLVDDIWQNGSDLKGEVHVLNHTETIEEEAHFHTSIKVYSLFILFYFLMSSSWVFELKENKLTNRLNHFGISQLQITLVSLWPSLLIAQLSFNILLMGLSFIYNHSIMFLWHNVIFFISNIGMLGLSLFIIAHLRNKLALLYITPLLSFVIAILSGLFFTLPNWAYTLDIIAYSLPNKWLSLMMLDARNYLLPAILCNGLWLLMGVTRLSLSKNNST